MKFVAIDDFVGELENLERRGFEVAAVHDYLSSTRIDPASLEAYVKYRRDRYARYLVHKNPAYEILVICWGTGQSAPAHGHEGQYCWARVESGTLRFTNYREVSEAPLVLERLAEPIVGNEGHLDGPADIHSVENLPEFHNPAVSLHVYYRPFVECDIYDLERREKRRARLSYDLLSEPTV